MTYLFIESFIYFLFRQVASIHFVTLSLVQILQQEIFSVWSSAGIHDVMEVFLVLSSPFSGYLYCSFGCILDF